jgi:myo-inositol-1(or 4)-monophosphatase
MEEPSKKFLKEAIKYLEPVIKKAGKMSLQRWDKVEITRQKDVRDIATKADIEIENFIKKKILSKWPEHGFWGEEGGKQGVSAFQWLVDPIDGTKFYVGLAPFFQTYISLTFERKPILGLIYNALSDQMFSAYQGGGAFLNGKKIVSKNTVPLKEAILNIDFGGLSGKNPEEKKWMLDKLSRLLERSYRVRMIAGALNIYLVTGAIDAYVDIGNSKPQELAARIIIMREAGFKVEKVKTVFGNKLVVAKEPLLSEIKQILSN